ncbi:hypothetical protein [Roseateles amylovorans]|jgi:hypothetical protein|uniref:Uncharacterized protein n=1 Tax=Roseateles amylovorans TaxID=2978473 RepID=A0ABY6B662_9BURK|nr:hypothetical protein [Roseateles amylovorans]UXH79431.1 hypothetical protein N4261_05750 [Roseateles amylovorans]
MTSPTLPDFYVVPIRKINGPDASIEHCLYYDTSWNNVAANNLLVNAGQTTVTLQEQTDSVPKPIQQGLKLIGWEVNSQVTLFSGTAKTLNQASPLPTNYDASGLPGEAKIAIDITSGTTRGVILVFRFPLTGDVQGLIATSDPEIKAGSSSGD